MAYGLDDIFPSPIVDVPQAVSTGSRGDGAQSTTSTAAKHTSDRHTKKNPGIPSNARIKVNGQFATPAQIDTMNEILDVAESKEVAKQLGSHMEKALLSLVCANIGESGYDKFVVGGAGGNYRGIYQIGPSWGNPLALEHLTKKFLVDGGFYKFGDALRCCKEHPEWTPGMIAGAVEGSDKQGAAAQAYYGKFEDEAKAIIAAYGGVYTNGITDTPSGDEKVAKAFLFTRPYPATANPYQNSWDCAKALADEVGWRLFAMSNRLYYFTEPRLAAQTPIIIDRTDPELAPYIAAGWKRSLNNSTEATTMTINIVCDPFYFHAGECVLLKGFGGGSNDRWIISDTRRSVYEEHTELTLIKPTYPQPEPAHDTMVASNGADGSSASDGASGPIRDRIVAEAKKTLTSKTNFSYYSQPGAMTDDPTPGPGKRSDCSQWVRAIYLKAGADDPGSNTTGQAAKGKRTSSPRPGDLMMTASTDHVELYVGDGKTIGHGSPPIDYATVDAFPGHYFVTFDFLNEGVSGEAIPGQRHGGPAGA